MDSRYLTYLTPPKSTSYSETCEPNPLEIGALPSPAGAYGLQFGLIQAC